MTGCPAIVCSVVFVGTAVSYTGSSVKFGDRATEAGFSTAETECTRRELWTIYLLSLHLPPLLSPPLCLSPTARLRGSVRGVVAEPERETKSQYRIHLHVM